MTAAAPVAVAIPGLNTGAIPAAPPISVPSVSAPARPTNSGQRTGGQIQSAQLVSSKPPEYPLAARQAHVQGVVEVLATIGIDGKVKAASAISGPPLLRKPAVDAVRQWTYKPTKLDGAAIESETHVEVRFTTGH
jgi:protein TonB